MLVLKIYFHVQAILKKALYKLLYFNKLRFGKNVTFRRRFHVLIEKSGMIEVGKGTFFNNDCSLNCLEFIQIGEDCLFGENVKIYDHNHRFRTDNQKIKEQGYATASITIGNNCWIGSNVVILKGTRIGNNCVIGAGTVLDTVVEDNTIITTNRVIERKRYNIVKE